MAEYLWKCLECGRKVRAVRYVDGRICAGGHKMVRDYRSENVGLGTGVRASREPTKAEAEALFLPSGDDLATPADPTGQKALREWNETHGPKPENKRPLRPKVDKELF